MKTIIKFEYNEKLYCVGVENNQFKYFYIKDDIEYFDLTKKEITFINKVLLKILPSGYFIKTSDYTINNNKYEIYYDKITGIRYFNPIPKEEDLIKLNLIFNNTTEYLTSFKDKWKFWNDEKFLNRVLIVESVLISVMASTLLITLVQNLHEQKLEEIEARNHYEMALDVMEDTSSLTDEEFIERIMQAVDENPNLSEREKGRLRSYEFAFLDNKEYSDIEFLEDTLSKLNFVYDEGDGIDWRGVYCGGWYAERDKEATFFNVSGLYDVNDGVFGHEVAHSFSKPLYHDKSNSFLVESNNVIFTDEYLADDGGYPWIVDYGKALMELIEPEVFKQYHSLPSMDLIVDELCKIINNENKAYKFLALLDEYKTLNDTRNVGEDYNPEIAKKNIANIKKEIYKLMDEYYYAKNNIHINDDLIMLHYMDNEAFEKRVKEIFDSKQINSNVDIDDMRFETIKEKFYFNSEYKDTHDGLVFKLILSDPYKEYILDIDDDSRYVQENNLEFNNEIFLKTGLGYMDYYNHVTYDILEDDEVVYTRILIELVGYDTVKQSVKNYSLEPIIEELCNLTGSKEKAINFLENIQKYCSLNNCNIGSDEYREQNEIKKKLKSNMYKQISNYYYAKTGKNIETDLLMLFYLDYDYFQELMIKNLDIEKEYDNIFCELIFENFYSPPYRQDRPQPFTKGLVFRLIGTTDLGDEECNVEEIKVESIEEENRYLKNAEIIDTNGYLLSEQNNKVR